MLGLIICIVSCSGYISLINAIVERGREELNRKHWSDEDSNCRYYCQPARIDSSSNIGSVFQCNTLSDQSVTMLFLQWFQLISILASPDDGRVQSAAPHQRSGTNTRPLTTTQIALSQSARRHNGVNTISSAKRFDQIERGTSPVDARILDEFYMDRPKDMHTYELDGRQYYVYEGKTLTELDNHRKGTSKRIKRRMELSFFLSSTDPSHARTRVSCTSRSDCKCQEFCLCSHTSRWNPPSWESSW